MGRIVSYCLIMVMSVFSQSVFGQSEEDVITKMDGEEMRGKVTKMGTESVTFVYSGEDLEYEVAKTNIHKIVFASGRTQVINEMAAPAAAQPATPVVSAADRKGKIAVLPFEFATNDPSLQGESFETRVQIDCARSLRENTSGLQVQDPRETNAILAQNNMDAQQLAAMTPADVAAVLGVEFVTYGTLKVDNEGAQTYGSSVTTYKDKEERERSKKSEKSTEVSSGSSTTVINYDVRVGINIYSDQGTSIFSDSREPFGSGTETYSAALDYMIKRGPHGSKHK